MNKFIFTAAISLVFLAAVGRSAPSTDPSKVEAGTYKIDRYHSQILFGIGHMGLSNFHGVFSDITGSVTVDPKSPGAGQGEFTVPIAKIGTTNTFLNKELASAKWFDAARFPNAIFKITAIRPTGARTAAIMGTLTLHGVTRPVTLTALLVGSGTNVMNKKATIGFDAITTIRRSDFGIGNFVSTIGDVVALNISIALEK